MVISNSGNTVLTVQQLPVLRLFPFSTDSILHSEKKRVAGKMGFKPSFPTSIRGSRLQVHGDLVLGAELGP